MLAEAPAPGFPMDAYDERQVRSCGRHRPFETEHEAWLVYLTLVVANRVDPGQTIYRCRKCWFFHYGRGGGKSLGRLLAEAGWADERAGGHDDVG